MRTVGYEWRTRAGGMNSALLRALALAFAAFMPVATETVLAQQAMGNLGGNGVDRQIELTMWQSIDSNNDPALYEAYLARFPNGTFADVARLKIAKLRGTAPPPAPVAQQPGYPPPQPVYQPPQPTYQPQVYQPQAPVAPPVVPQPPVPQPQVQPGYATAPVAPGPVYPPPPPVAQPPVVAPPVVAPPVVAPPVSQPPATQPPVAPPAVVPAPVATAPGGEAAGGGADQLQELNRTLQDMVNSQVSTTPPGGPPPVVAPPVAPAATVAAPVTPVPVTQPQAGAQVINGIAIPPPPVMEPVAQVVLPARFCTDVERNTFHSTQYAPVIAAAKRNNEAAVAYMARLNAIYDRYHQSDNTIAQNAIVDASRAYEPQAQAAFATHDALVRLYPAIMAVPIIACPAPK